MTKLQLSEHVKDVCKGIPMTLEQPQRKIILSLTGDEALHGESVQLRHKHKSFLHLRHRTP